MPPKNKNKKSATPVESTRHKDKRKNAVPVGLASYDTSKPKQMGWKRVDTLNN